MANFPNNMPISLDTDIASWGAAQTLQARAPGIRVYKLALQAVGTTVAGAVTITNPIDGSILLPTMVVAAGSVANTMLYYDNITDLLTWKDFSTTGLTATNTRLFIWYRS